MPSRRRPSVIIEAEDETATLLVPDSYIPRTIARAKVSWGAAGRALASIAEEDEATASEVVGGATELKDIAVNDRLAKAVADRARGSAHAAARAISRFQSVYLCFLLDTTGSMSSVITTVKEQIKEIVDAVHDMGCSIEGVSFVGYKDW